MNIQAKTNSSKAIDYVSELTADDVVFASAGPRSHRPYKPISINSAQNTGRFLRWALQSGKPDPAKWRDLHQKTAIAQKSGSNSAAAKSYAEIADLLVPQHRYDDLKSLRLQSINCQRRQFELSALMLRYKTWAPKVTIAGASKKLLEERTQNPAMYWKDSTSYGDNVGRLGLWLAGVNAHEFNDITHAYGATYFGRLLLQRLILRVEDRYIASRSWSRPGTHYSAVRSITRHLKQGDPVTIHNNAFLGRRFACVPLSPEHYFVQATAPINLAYRYKVPIIPYTVLEEIPFESYSLTLHEPMETDPQQSLDENIRRIALLSVKRQIEAVAERPDQWMVFKGGQITKPRNGRINRNGM